MNATLIGVVITCVLVGYWIVAAALNHFSAEKNNRKSDDHAGSEYPAQESWYEILEVSPTASVDEIQNAYKQMIKQYHPDKVATLGKEIRDLAEHKSKEINGAYTEGLRIRKAIN